MKPVREEPVIRWSTVSVACLLLSACSTSPPPVVPPPASPERRPEAETLPQRIRRIEGLLNKKSNTQALEEAARLRAEFPGDPDAEGLYGFSVAVNGDLDRGLAILSTVISNNDTPRLRMYRARALDQKRDYAGAIEDYSAILLRVANSAEILIDRANDFIKLNRIGEAMGDLDRVLKANPGDAEGNYLFGECLRTQGDAAAALKVLNLSIEKKPDLAGAYFSRALSRQQLGQIPEALEDFGKAISLNPRHPEFYKYRGILLDSLDRHREALADIDTAVRLSPSDSGLFEFRATLHDALEDEKKAFLDLDEAIRLNPVSAEAFRLRANLHLNAKQPEKALSDAEKAVELAPNDSDVFYVRGRAKYRLKKYPQALADYDKAIDLDRENAQAFDSRADLKKKLGDDLGAEQDRARSKVLEQTQKPGPESTFLRVKAALLDRDWIAAYRLFNPSRRDAALHFTIGVTLLTLVRDMDVRREFAGLLRHAGADVPADGSFSEGSYEKVADGEGLIRRIAEFAGQHRDSEVRLQLDTDYLKDVRIVGNSAIGTAVKKNGDTKPTKFVRIGGKWYLDE